jgi:hypothetical protein
MGDSPNKDEKRVRYGPKRAASWGIKRSTYWRLLKEVVGVGLIDEVKKPRFGHEGEYDMTSLRWIECPATRKDLLHSIWGAPKVSKMRHHGQKEKAKVIPIKK